MYEEIIDKLYDEYLINGYISEDKIFDELQALGVKLFDVEYICDQLLSRGVLFLEANGTSNEENDAIDLARTDYDSIFAEIIELNEGLSSTVEYIKKVPPPQRREWQRLIVQAQNGNKYAKTRLFEMYMRVAASIALRYVKRYNFSIEETIEDAFWGLLVAIDKFDKGKQKSFPTYFPFWVRQFILRESRLKNVTFECPAHVKDKLFVVFEIISSHYCCQCSDNDVCPALVASVSSALQCEEDESIRLIHLFDPVESIEDLCEIEYADENCLTFSDNGDCNDWLIEEWERSSVKALINNATKVLTPKEELVIKLRFGIDQNHSFTLEELGKRLGITRERIRQIEAKALRKLRRLMGKPIEIISKYGKYRAFVMYNDYW